MFFDREGVTSPRPTELAGVSPEVCDEAALSVLQFGACVPPWSPWKGVSRFLPGYRYRGTELIEPLPIQHSGGFAHLDAERQADRVVGLIDAILCESLTDAAPIVLFSGGVDSGILAGRLAALGRSDTVLVNYSFGPTDQEADLAEQMASELGLRYERVFASRDLCASLDEPGRVYPMPFGDSSTVPTSDLAHSVVGLLQSSSSLIIDGTGADGAFGMVGKSDRWRQVYRVPRVARNLAGSLYRSTLWLRPGRFEAAFKVACRAAQLPLMPASLAQNALRGTHYDKQRQRSVHQDLSSWVAGVVGDNTRTQVIAGDLALVCANIFAQKSLPILQGGGHDVLYPFLHPEMLAEVLASGPEWRMRVPKEPLKVALARLVPKWMVERPKSGFTDPESSVFFTVGFIDHLREACKPSSPIAHLVDQSRMLEACRYLEQGRALPVQTGNLLWAFVFTDRWYRTAVA